MINSVKLKYQTEYLIDNNMYYFFNIMSQKCCVKRKKNDFRNIYLKV